MGSAYSGHTGHTLRYATSQPSREHELNHPCASTAAIQNPLLSRTVLCGLCLVLRGSDPIRARQVASSIRGRTPCQRRSMRHLGLRAAHAIVFIAELRQGRYVRHRDTQQHDDCVDPEVVGVQNLASNRAAGRRHWSGVGARLRSSASRGPRVGSRGFRFLQSLPRKAPHCSMPSGAPRAAVPPTQTVAKRIGRVAYLRTAVCWAGNERVICWFDQQHGAECSSTGRTVSDRIACAHLLLRKPKTVCDCAHVVARP